MSIQSSRVIGARTRGAGRSDLRRDAAEAGARVSGADSAGLRKGGAKRLDIYSNILGRVGVRRSRV